MSSDLKVTHTCKYFLVKINHTMPCLKSQYNPTSFNTNSACSNQLPQTPLLPSPTFFCLTQLYQISVTQRGEERQMKQNTQIST